MKRRMSRLICWHAMRTALIALTAGGEGALCRLFAEGQEHDAQCLCRPVDGSCFRGASMLRFRGGLIAIEGASEEALLDLAYQLDLPIVATNPANFAEADFHAAHDAMLCIASSAYVESDDRNHSSPDAWMKPAQGYAAFVR